MQGLANADEICITDAVRHASHCEAILLAKGFTLHAETSQLRGVEQARQITRCKIAMP